jgi:serine/threonine-protein kinase
MGTVLVTGDRIYRVPLAGNRKPATSLKTADISIPRVSADGRGIAYQSDESGRFKVYIAAFLRSKKGVQVSNGGGCQPQWRKDGKELSYLDFAGKRISVAVKASRQLRRELCFRHCREWIGTIPQYAVSGDDTTFLLANRLTRRMCRSRDAQLGRGTEALSTAFVSHSHHK